MLRIMNGTEAVTFVAFLVAGALFASDCVWAAPENAAEASHVAASADLNRDGISDLAQITLPAGNSSAPATLTILLG